MRALEPAEAARVGRDELRLEGLAAVRAGHLVVPLGGRFAHAAKLAGPSFPPGGPSEPV